MNKDIFRQADKFVKERFVKYPHHSFGDWRVMYEHSVDVKNFALKISKTAKSDREVAGLSALLHDIGKTYKASGKYLEIHAHRLNAVVAKPLLTKLGLTNKQIKKIKSAIAYKGHSIERKIMQDADALAFFKDKRLHTLYFNWALNEKKLESLKRHVNKYNNLHFKISKQMGKPWFDKMMSEWEHKLKIHLH